jgi:hypothetical protein
MSEAGERQNPRLDHLHAQLMGAVELLDLSCDFIPEDMNRTENIRRIGEALAKIFQVADDLYLRRPDLLPPFLREKPPGQRPE